MPDDDFDRFSREPYRGMCAFCGSTEQMTKEDAWPKWAGETLERFGPFRARRGSQTWETAKIDTAVRAVCATCNNGWMSQIEGETKPILEPLILARPDHEPDSDTPRAPTRVLSPLDQRKLAIWAAKTVLTLDLINRPRTIPNGEYRVFGQKHRPSGNQYIWLGAYKGARWATRVRISPLFLMRGNERVSDIPNGYAATLTLRHAVFFIVRIGNDRAQNDTQELSQQAIRLWPPSGKPARWPRNLVGFDDKTIDSLGVDYWVE